MQDKIHLIHTDYPLDLKQILQDAEEASAIKETYTDARYDNRAVEGWDVARWTSPYIEKIVNDFGFEKVKTRFYWQEPNILIPPHIDYGSTVSLNFVLTDKPAPITMDNVEYHYKQGLINTGVKHSVQNGNEPRLILKITIYDKTFEEVAENLKWRKKEQNV